MFHSVNCHQSKPTSITWQMKEHLAHLVKIKIKNKKLDFGDEDYLIFRNEGQEPCREHAAERCLKGEFSGHGRLQADSLPGVLRAFL